MAQPSQPYGGPNRTVYRPGTGVTNPEPIHKTEPAYTEKAREAKLEGTVVLEVVVDEAGKPISAKVLRPLRPLELGLNEMAVEAALGWRFKPGTKDGKAVAVATQIEIAFHLPNSRCGKSKGPRHCRADRETG